MAHVIVPIIYVSPDGGSSTKGYKVGNFVLGSTLHEIFDWALNLRAEVGEHAIIGDMVINGSFGKETT